MLWLFICSVFVSCTVFATNENDWPIVGIVAQPSTSTAAECNGDCQNLAAGYVKFLEQAGARVIPINYYSDNATIDAIFPKLSGVLFPGGGTALTPTAQYIFDRTVAANDAGDFMPLFGICMGFQWLLMAATRDTDILDGYYDSYNYSIPLDFTPEVAHSRMFASAPASVLRTLATEDVTMNNHQYGILPEHFAATPSLSSFYRMISTNVDRADMPFVSTMEAFEYPIYGLQWHPEKNQFEWGHKNDAAYENINHTPAALDMAQYIAKFFVSEARKCTHRFSDVDEEDSMLIYNYPKTRTGPSNVETYFFDNDF